MKPWEQFKSSEAPQSAGPWQSFQPQSAPEQQKQPDYSNLPEFGSSQGLSALFGDGEGFLDGQLGGDTVGVGQLFKDALAQTFTMDSKARVDGIEKRFPELQIERIGDGSNAIVTNPKNGKQAIVNQKGFSPQDFQQIMGGVAAFTPAGKGVGMVAAPGTKIAVAAGGAAATDAALQGVEKLQGSNQDFNLGRTALSGALGGGLQGIGQQIGQSINNGAAKKLVEKVAPSIDDLKDVASKLYKQVDDLGVSLKPQSYQGLLKKLQDTADDFGFLPEIQKQSSAALNALTKRDGSAPTFSDLNNLRKVLGNAAQTSEKSDAALASRLIKVLDNSLEKLPNSAIQGSGATAKQATSLLKQARGEVAKRKRSELIEQAIVNGQNAASGAENGIRNEMRALLKRINTGKIGGFTKEEIGQIRGVANGTLNSANIMRLIGKGAFNPSGNNFLGGSIGATVSGTVAGPTGVIVQQGLSQGAKKLAERATTNNARLASAIARAGNNSLKLAQAYVKAVPKSKRSAQELAEIIKQQGGSAQELLERAAKMGGGNKETAINAAKLLLAEETAN